MLDPPNKIKLPENSPVIVCYGGGVDSTAMLIAMRDAGIVPDLITFADVGGEKPDTYHYVRSMDSWLVKNGFPKVTWCKKITTDRVEYSDLEGNCVDNETLPSLAFGMKSCSIKWKAGPQDYHVKGCKSGPNKCDPHPIWIESRETGIKPVKLIGYDSSPADIRRSGKIKTEDNDFFYAYPLQDLGWKREDCVKRIAEEGLPVPIKSACFFCPASKKWELWWLAGAHPDLFERALVMEYRALVGKHSRFDEVEFGDSWENMIRNADRFPSSNTTVGLGRGFAWNHWARTNKVVDDSGAVVMDPEECLARANSLKRNDNALDMRTC
ncbi:MAG: hypothetical protein JRC99_12130 [Deltaproteobacteria bacterium]|nr:hypothetical protein [Deltaproteobacteria bacterium]